MYGEMQTIVIDNGSRNLKVGYSGEDAPRFVFRTGLETQRPDGYTYSPLPDTYIGDETSVLTLSPIKQGTVTNWDDMQKAWDYAFYHKLGVPPAAHPVILTEPRNCKKADREKMMQIMFETFSVPSCYLGMQAVLSLYSAGRMTGIVLDSGESATNIVPVYEGYSIPHAIKTIPVGGRDVINRLSRLLEERGYFKFPTEVVRNMMEKVAYVSSLNSYEEIRECNMDCIVPGGINMTVGRERFRCTEDVFYPRLNEWNKDGIHRNLFNSINMCNADIRKDLYSNIILSGGTTMIQGFSERIQKEIKLLAPWSMSPKVIASPQRDSGAWIGGSTLGLLDCFPRMTATYKEYNELGVGIVHRKCL